MRPTDPVYAANGNYFQIPGTFANFNPLAALEKKTNTQRLQDFLFNASAGYTILDGLVFNVSGTLRTQNANNSYFAATTPGNLLSTVGGNSASRSLKVRLLVSGSMAAAARTCLSASPFRFLLPMFRLFLSSPCIRAPLLRLHSSVPTKLHVGFHVSEARTFTMEDVKQFAILGRDS